MTFDGDLQVRNELSVYSNVDQFKPFSPLHWSHVLVRLVHRKMNFLETADSRIVITRQRKGEKLWPTCQLEAHGLLYPMSPRFADSQPGN